MHQDVSIIILYPSKLELICEKHRFPSHCYTRIIKQKCIYMIEPENSYSPTCLTSTRRLTLNWSQQPPRPLLVSEAFFPEVKLSQTHSESTSKWTTSCSRMFLRELRSCLALGYISLSACRCGRFKLLYTCTDEGLVVLLCVNHHSQQRG